MKVIILAGGKGEKVWPYNEIRNKCMIPISNKPIIGYLVDALKKHQLNDIHIIGSSYMDEIKHYFRYDDVNIIMTDQTNGNVETLLQSHIHEEFIFLYGDCIVDEDDIKRLIDSPIHSLLIGKVYDDPHNHILALHQDHLFTQCIAYPRGYDEGSIVVGGHFDQDFIECIQYNRGRFKNTKVGVGSPNEKIIEESLNDFVLTHKINVIESKHQVFDIDKPYHILDANAYLNKKKCSLDQSYIDESAMIDDSSVINGFIKIGKHSKIGKNVYIKGNVIIGDHTVIENGAVIEGNVVIGNHCMISNHCKIGALSTIGHDCIFEHTAELCGGIIMDKNYLYHHGEFFGICGERCDLGAGSVCGTLRFDDGLTKADTGRKEYPGPYSNATYLGDYTRVGVSAIFLPGSIVGVNSVIGAGAIISKKIGSYKLVYPKQELIEKDWSYKKYGW